MRCYDFLPGAGGAALSDGGQRRFNSFYNTYKCTGLPEGPICNPGMDAINAALNPEQTDYFYFATDKAGKYYYAKTLAEHEKNWSAIKKVNAALETASQTKADG